MREVKGASMKIDEKERLMDTKRKKNIAIFKRVKSCKAEESTTDFKDK
jgi:hypothetical protein